MVNICLINTHFPPYVSGGAENYVLRVAKELQRIGHQVSVIATKPYDGPQALKGERDEYEGVTVYYFYPMNISHKSNGTGSNPLSKTVWHNIDTFNPHSKLIVKSLLKKIGPDIVHTHNLMGISTMVSRSIRELSLRHIHTLHDYSLICPKSNLLRERTAPDGEVAVCSDPPAPCRGFKMAKKQILGSPDIVTAPSKHILEIHAKHGYFSDVPRKKLQLGISETISDVPTTNDDDSVLFVGKHLKSKGLDTMYEAACKLPNVTFHICGTGVYDHKTKKCADKYDNIQYHGFVSQGRLKQLRTQVSAGVIPSIWMENSPLTIYESFAAGLPMVGSEIGGIPELIQDGETGWLFEPGNSEDLTKTISKNVINANTHEIRRNVIDWAKNHSMQDHINQLLGSVYQI